MVVEQDGAMLRYKYARIIQGLGIWIKQGAGRCFGWVCCYGWDVEFLVRSGSSVELLMFFWV